jgi:beta-glucosidase/6-phospho-beta-glucosidase/beta-galactosidase
MSRATS